MLNIHGFQVTRDGWKCTRRNNMEILLAITCALALIIFCLLIAQTGSPTEDDEQEKYLKEREEKQNLKKR